MYETHILNQLALLSRQPFLMFTHQMESKQDNTFKTLKFLANKEQVTAGMISEFLDVKPSSVTQIIKKLEEAGTAKRVKSKEDARVTLVEITEKGSQVLEDKKDFSDSLYDELFKGFSEEDLEKLDCYLSMLIDNLSNEKLTKEMSDFFSNDERWQHFEQMSSRFGRARGQMMDGVDFDMRKHHHMDRDNRGPKGFGGWKRGK
ncbi:MarR family winged helix-turn-helix transcriptional regulator [Vagococcus jeotgali]|uniref:MarR family winged helix-turn-helix transcriptional regulator n=1 Tax=Vagococcus jeotgali TaxID=3109030 RepID=UPI002DD9BACB|nr:MarR family transcriptional regulator [Vagococcus sp. B2T-5]